MDEILAIPDVADASFCNQSPFGRYYGNNVQIPGSSETLFNISDGYWNDSHWFEAVISDIYVLKIANSNPSESLKTE